MRVLLVFPCVLAALVALPQSVAARFADGATISKPANAAGLVRTQNLLPPLMLRTSYRYLDLDALSAEPAASSVEKPADESRETTQRPAQSTQPPRSWLERWHPEAFVDPSKPASEPALELKVDSAGLEVTPTAPPTLEESELAKKRRRRIGIAVGVLVAAVATVGITMGAVAASFSRSFD